MTDIYLVSTSVGAALFDLEAIPGIVGRDEEGRAFFYSASHRHALVCVGPVEGGEGINIRCLEDALADEIRAATFTGTVLVEPVTPSFEWA